MIRSRSEKGNPERPLGLPPESWIGKARACFEICADHGEHLWTCVLQLQNSNLTEPCAGNSSLQHPVPDMSNSIFVQLASGPNMRCLQPFYLCT